MTRRTFTLALAAFLAGSFTARRPLVGVAVILAGALALLAYRAGATALGSWRDGRRAGLTIRAWLAAHAFTGDSVADVAEVHGGVTYSQVQADAYRQGREDEAWQAHERRSEAARRGAAKRKAQP